MSYDWIKTSSETLTDKQAVRLETHIRAARQYFASSEQEANGTLPDLHLLVITRSEDPAVKTINIEWVVKDAFGTYHRGFSYMGPRAGVWGYRRDRRKGKDRFAPVDHTWEIFAAADSFYHDVFADRND